MNTEIIEMAKLRFDGAWCISSVDDALDQLRELESDDVFEFKKIWMTQAELDALPEFNGW